MISAMSGGSGTPEGPVPSATNVWDPGKVQREMTVDEIHQYVEWFAIGAKAAKDAGIDGVEIHTVHEGYLLDQFAIDSFNQRTDEYGGSLENRLRFPTEIVQAIKAKCGKDFPVSLRYSVKSYKKRLIGEQFREKSLKSSEGIMRKVKRLPECCRKQAMIC